MAVIVGIAIVAIATCGLALLLLASKGLRDTIHVCVREIQGGSHINLHYISEKPAEWQRNAVNSLIGQMNRNISNNEHISDQLNAASCCVAIHFNHGEENSQSRSSLTRQFLFKTEEGFLLTKENLMQRIKGMGKELSELIDTEIDVATTSLYLSCALLHQDVPGSKVKASFDEIGVSERSIVSGADMSVSKVPGALQLTDANWEGVLSEDVTQILAGPNCVAI